MAQQLQKCPTYGDIKFTNGISKKATEHKDRGLVFRKIADEHIIFLVYHDAAWANAYEGEYDEEGFELYADDKANGLQREGPPSHRNGRKAKRGNSRVASQLGELVMIADVRSISGGSGWGSILDWKSRAGQSLQEHLQRRDSSLCRRSRRRTICSGGLRGDHQREALQSRRGHPASCVSQRLQVTLRPPSSRGHTSHTCGPPTRHRPRGPTPVTSRRAMD